jgi:Ca-activated chloride channel family protein
MRFASILRRLALFLLLALPGIAQAEGRTIIVLDGSGSMWGQIDGRPKLEIAREALETVLASMPADTELGLIAYGHRTKGDCDDIETLVAPATGTAQGISDAAAKMQFLGKTPLTEAVRRAAAELHSTEEKATVVLITDGIETCQGDPCALAQELETSGVDFTAHVVGFGLTKAEGQEVACLADMTGGQFITADSLQSLVVALQTTVISTPQPEPEPVPEPEPAKPAQLDINFAPRAFLAPDIPVPEDGDVSWNLYVRNSDGSIGERYETEYNDFKGFVEPGAYRLITTLGSAETEQDITLSATELSAPDVVLNAAKVMLHPKGTPDGPVEDNASLNFKADPDVDTTEYGDTRIYLPAGEVTLTASLGVATQTETLTLKPGETLDRDVVIAVGLAAIEAYYVDGMHVDGGAHQVQVLSVTKDIEGDREVFNTGYGQDFTLKLSPGDYIARVELDAASAETPFTVKPGERTDVSVVLNAGVLAVDAPGASSIAVYKAKTDLNGNRTQMAFDYAASLSKVMPEGDYLIEVERGDAISKADAHVTKGERSEVAVP